MSARDDDHSRMQTCRCGKLFEILAIDGADGSILIDGDAPNSVVSRTVEPAISHVDDVVPFTP